MRNIERSKEREEYVQGLKKVLIPSLFGILAGVICFYLYVAYPLMVIDDGTVATSLDRGIIPANLSARFEDMGIALGGDDGQNITVVKMDRGADKWVINSEYIIRRQSERLNIYQSPISEDWLLIALLLVLVQKFVYPYMHTRIEGAKDWLSVGFITSFCWFIVFTLLLTALF